MNQEVHDAIADLVAFYGHGPFDVKGENTCGVSSLSACSIVRVVEAGKSLCYQFRLRVSLQVS